MGSGLPDLKFNRLCAFWGWKLGSSYFSELCCFVRHGVGFRRKAMSRYVQYMVGQRNVKG